MKNLNDEFFVDMIWVEPGSFTMGAPEGEMGRWNDDETQHQETISQGFWLGKYPVTQALYKAIMGKNPSKFKGDNHPVESVTWDDAVSFCEKLTAQEKAAGRLPEGYKYTLPTDVQWEYACRAGTNTALNNGKNLTSTVKCPNMDELGWYYYNSKNQTHPVGQKEPNNWGFYDMHGNVWEWCLDWFPGYEGLRKILRGGSWRNYANYCRASVQLNRFPGVGYDYYGFRVALSPIQ